MDYAAASGGAYIRVDRGIVVTSDALHLTARNLYDEVLSDKARISGTLTLRLKNIPSVRRTLQFSKSDVWTQSMVAGDIVTIKPGQTFGLARTWDHRTDGMVPFWSFLPLIRDSTASGEIYFRSDTAWFQVTGSLQVFENSQAGDIPLREFPYVYALFNTIADTLPPD